MRPLRGLTSLTGLLPDNVRGVHAAQIQRRSASLAARCGRRRTYCDYGQTVRWKVCQNVHNADIYSLAANTPGAGYTRVTLNVGVSAVTGLANREVRVTVAGNSCFSGVVSGTGNDGTRDYIDLVDGSSALYGALNGNAVGLSVLDCVDNYTGGTWTSGPSNAGGSSGATTFTCSGATFASYMVGWTLVANVDKPTYFTIASVPSATTLTVSGDCDATSISQSGDRFEILAPACVASYGETGSNSIPGAIADPRDYGAPDSADPGSRLLWAGYWYLPPQVGINVASSITGTQPTLSNLLGNYHCWNRVYSPFMGRWTTPDPAMSPFWNLWDYCSGRPSCWTGRIGDRSNRAHR